MYKLKELFNTQKKSELCMLRTYITEAVKLRNYLLVQPCCFDLKYLDLIFF